VCAAGDFKATVSNSTLVVGGTALLCTLQSEPVTNCRFTRPDGEVILLNDGIGNADYSYYGNGFNKGDCGLTIHRVQEVDRGQWKCTVFSYAEQRVGFLYVEKNGKFCFFLT
jgi:hypothetical protein